MTQQPSTSGTAGTAFGTQPTVTVKDQYGNLVSNGTTVTATETSGGNLNGHDDGANGEHDFWRGDVQRIVCDQCGQSGDADVHGQRPHGGVGQHQRERGVGEQAGGHAAAIGDGDGGRGVCAAAKVTAQDTYGNTVSNYAVTVTAAETSGGNLNGTTTAQTATPANGVATFSGCM